MNPLLDDPMPDARCKGEPPELFFGTTTELDQRKVIEHEKLQIARQVCSSCPYTGQDGLCYTQGRQTNDRTTIRGGHPMWLPRPERN